jgi:hypothetical protein
MPSTRVFDASQPAESCQADTTHSRPLQSLIKDSFMTEFEFTVILAGVSEITEELADALFEAGCDDATPSSSGGVTRVAFDREARSLEDAIRSAIANVQAAGCTVARVEIDAEAAVLKV